MLGLHPENMYTEDEVDEGDRKLCVWMHNRSQLNPHALWR